MASWSTQRLKIAQAPHQEATDGREIGEDSRQCHQSALQRLAPARHSPLGFGEAPPDCSNRHSEQIPPAISLQLCINLQTLIRRYGMEHAMLNLMQAVVPSSNVTSVTTSIMIVKVLKTFPPGTSDQNAMSEDGSQLQLGSSICYAVKTIQRGHTDCCRSVAVRAQY
jgi:hypothetical protein